MPWVGRLGRPQTHSVGIWQAAKGAAGRPARTGPLYAGYTLYQLSCWGAPSDYNI